MDAYEPRSDTHGDANRDEYVTQTYTNDLWEYTEKKCENESNSFGENNVLQHDLDQTKEHHENLEKMHQDLRYFVTRECDRRNTTTSTAPDALQTNSTNDPSLIVQLKCLFQEHEKAVSVQKHELDQKQKHNESLEKMHKDLQDFVTRECNQRKTTQRNPVAKVNDTYDIVSDISGYYHQLQRELDKYEQKVQKLTSREDYYTYQHKWKETYIVSLTREIDNMKKQLQKETNQYEQTIKKLKDQKQMNVELVERQIGLQKINHAQKYEIEAVKLALDQAHKNINNYVATGKQHNSMITQLEGTIHETSNQIQQQTLHIRSKDQTIEQLQKHITTLEEQRNTLTLRLSKLAGAHRTRNNPNITDLSAMNPPTKLLERYSELYDNEWTDAYEECTVAWNMDEETCVKTMLDLLKIANDECLNLLQPHRDILKTLTMVTVKLDKSAVKQDTHADFETRYSKEDRNVQTDVIFLDGEVQTEERDRTGEFLEQSTEEIFEISGRSQDKQCHSPCTTKTTVEQPSMVADPPFKSNVDTGEVTAEIKVTDVFTVEQKKTVSDMRKLCGTNLEREGEISKIIAKKIAIERGIDNKSNNNVMTYITKCAELCWHMAIQEPPVVIGFQETAAVGQFDKDVYKLYSRVGKKLDFVVWPPLYLHKDGAMLCKGTAQAKN